MKENWKFAYVVSAALLVVFGVSNVYGQYGACGPTCETPAATCAPTCEVPSCEPTCEPTCAAPSCDVGCGMSYGCEAGCCEGNCCFDLCGLVSGALNVAVSPFKWIVCEFTDGIYPDCGCAPRPEKTPCNPCTICGDYVGGCNDYCDSLPYGNCGGYGCCEGQEGVYSQSQCAYTGAASTGVYSSAVYDAEQYDSSPTHGGAQVPTLPINRNSQNNFSSLNKVRNFNVQDMAGGNRVPTNVRSVSYEQSAMAKQGRANNVRQPQNQTRSQQPKVNKQPRANDLQNKPNVRIVSETTEVVRDSNAKTFGKTRPVKGR